MNAIESLLGRAMTYLASAKLLRKAGDYESAVSRGYYAMFYAAEAALLKVGVSSGSHKGVLSEFGRHYVKTGVLSHEIGRALGRAFEKRQLGDYEFRRVLTLDDATTTEREAEEFVARIVEMLGPSAHEKP